MTEQQRIRIREIITTVQQSGIAFAYQPHRQVPEYSQDWAMKEIEATLKKTPPCEER